MDTAEYDTNTLLINNIASVAFRIYESPSDLSHSFASAALDIENTLRQDGHVVFYDAARRVIWHFQILGKEGHEDINSRGLGATLELCGHVLVLGEEGILEPTSMQKPRSQQQQQAIHTPTSSVSSASPFDQPQRNVSASASQGPGSSSQDQEAKAADSSGVESKAGGTIPHKTVYENFITAVLLSISATFCSRTGAIPLNYRTVLFPSEPMASDDDLRDDSYAEQCPVLGTLKAYLTTTGALVIGFAVSRCKGLTSLADLVTTSFALPGTPILAAPFGVMANNQLSPSGEAGTASLAPTPNTQALSLRGGPDVHESTWKLACLKVLRMRGVASSRLADCSWVNLFVSKPKFQEAKAETKRPQAPGSTITIPWPGSCCFHKKAVEVSSTGRVGDTLLSGHEESHDPLGNARGWFNSASERDEKMSRRKAERVAASKDASSAESRAPKPTVASPVVIRQPSTTAVSAIYPTPPDGVQHLNGVTPSLDGTLSSPGNPLSAAPATDADHAAANASCTLGDTFDVGGDLNEAKQQRSENNLLGEADHMFGDVAGDMFDDNDITEADFNFFDEQPGDMNLDISIGDVGVSNHTVDATPKADEGPARAANQVKAEGPWERDVVVFAKPELKHARSSRNDIVGRDARPRSTKRDSSPFDPHTVFKRVRASLAVTRRGSSFAVPDSARVTRIFDSMNFDPTLPMINKKYEQGGQFDYKKITSLEKPKLEPGTLPETDYLKRHGRQGKKLRDRRLHAGSLVRTLTGPELQTSQPSPTKMEGFLSDDDGSSVGSDQDDSSYTTEEPSSPLKSSVKLMTMDDDVASQVTSLKDFETVEEPEQQFALELPRLSKPETSELPLALLFADPEPLSLELSLCDEDLIQVAQILTDQAAVGSLDMFNTREGAVTTPSSTKLHGRTLSADARNAQQILRDLVPSILRGAAAVSLKAFLDIADIPLLGQPTRLQPRPIPGRDPNAEALRPSNLYQIPGPHLEVRRSEMKLSVLPSAVRFWESLGLAPSSGGKDVNAICVFPGWNGMVDDVKAFLSCLKSVYEMLRLGSWESMPLPADMEDGILPYEVDRISTSPDATMTGHGSALVESMETLRGAISNLTVAEQNIVVYFVYSPNNPGTIVEACIAFQRFFGSYRKTLATQREAAPNELVLQLVSADTLSSPTSVVVTPAPELIKLCMETYDRCTLFGGPMPAPAIRLEQPLPRIIDFKPTVSPSASLIRENSCIHVAYAQSVDERWVTAAWTDDRGNQQETASYCLGRKGRPQSRSTNEVAHEIWESTLDLMSVWKVHWRIIITKCGPMDQQEIDFWTDLARTEMKASVTMILMTVDTNPSLQLIPPVVKLSQPSAPFYTTPVSTPQANIVSPEQSGTPATPARDANAMAATPVADGTGEPDGDGVLTDLTDQTWGAVVGHRLNNSLSVLEMHPALVSGYLIKRAGTRIEDAPVLMEVNLVHTDASPRTYEPLLREMLSYFRGLGTLARARGVVPRETDVRPWHIAAAEKGVRAMHLLL